MKSRYVYHKGEVIYAEESGEVKINKMPESIVADFMIMPDIQPYRSMIDGSLITSRSKHRSHLRQHGCIEIGNDSSIKNPRPQPLKPPPGLKDEIIRAVDKVTSRR